MTPITLADKLTAKPAKATHPQWANSKKACCIGSPKLNQPTLAKANVIIMTVTTLNNILIPARIS
jgi:hypothetical protein